MRLFICSLYFLLAVACCSIDARTLQLKCEDLDQEVNFKAYITSEILFCEMPNGQTFLLDLKNAKNNDDLKDTINSNIASELNLMFKKVKQRSIENKIYNNNNNNSQSEVNKNLIFRNDSLIISSDRNPFILKNEKRSKDKRLRRPHMPFRIG
jgi:hypothetical protein